MYETRRFFGGNSDALRCIKSNLESANLIRIATAYFEASGYQQLQDALRDKELRLLIGREQGGTDRLNDILDEFMVSLSTGSLLNRTNSMRQMLDALERGQVLIGVGDDPTDKTTFLDGRYLYQHAKLYIADELAVVVTSANMSEHGLMKSREAGNTVVNYDDVLFFVQRFEEYFARAKSLTERFIKELRAWLEAYDPYVIYARALLELYKLPLDETFTQLPPLADYQRPAVTRVRNNIEEHNGAMLIASTGLGKTIMAAHVVAYLRMENLIDSAIVVCPAGLREVWRRTMRAAKVSSVEFSYHTLSADDVRRNQQLTTLEYELKHATAKTLVIIDESHHLRNDDQGERLRNNRIREIVRSKNAKLLLMTATPFSKDIQDVNNQLKLLPEPSMGEMTELNFSVAVQNWEVETSYSLSELPPCFVLTTPTVVKHFSHTDEHGERYVLFSRNDRRYFPRRLKLRAIFYQNPLDGFLVELLERRLLDRTKSSHFSDNQATLFDLDDYEVSSERNPLFESQLVHQFCSSPAKVIDFCEGVRQSRFRMSFAKQEELNVLIDDYSSLLQNCLRVDHDPKLEHLLQIIEEADGEKIVVFCIYKETARILVNQIREHLPNITVETTVGHDSDKVDTILQCFAPTANEVEVLDDLPSNPIQVLIATGAMSEGFNLQDAPILVNYDLPWTVLQLAQRMGRILRPWHEPREITIYNLISSTMHNEQLYMAMNWQKRLINYSEEYRSFADIPVLLHSGDQELEMIDLARGLQEFGEVDLDLDQVMEFVENADGLYTTSFYDDLARISPDRAEEIQLLPPGIRTARRTRNGKRLFVLFKYRRKYYPALFDARGRMVESHKNPDAIMKIIRCEENTPRVPFDIYPNDDDFDEWIEKSKLNWANERKIEEASMNEIQIICVMALV